MTGGWTETPCPSLLGMCAPLLGLCSMWRGCAGQTMWGLGGGCTNNQWWAMGFCMSIHIVLLVQNLLHDLISSKLPPVQWHDKQLVSVVFLQCSDCPEAPQSLHLPWLSWTQLAAYRFPSQSDFFYIMFLFIKSVISLSWKIHCYGKESYTRPSLCRISWSDPGSKSSKLCPSTLIYDLIYQSKPQLTILS